MIDKVERYNDITHEISKLYAERNKLEKEIVDEFLSDKEKYKEIESQWFLTSFAFKSNKVIDYEKMERDYPEIYVLGLKPTFSKQTLLKSVDKDIANKIIRECTYLHNRYEIKRKRKYKKVDKGDKDDNNDTNGRNR